MNGLEMEQNITCQYINVTCNKYATIHRKLFKRNPSHVPNSYVKYFFDFTDSLERQGNESSAAEKHTYFQPRQAYSHDFYSISFELNINASMINDSLTQSIDFKANLFNLNTFDRVTFNTVFLFGLNIYAKKLSSLNKFQSDVIHYEFEMATSQEKLRSKIISLNEIKTLNINVTFDAQSIDLRIENRSDFLLRLTNKNQMDVYKHLLKANGPFQLNITSMDYPDDNNVALASELATLDYSNFVLLTRKKNQANYIYKTYNLIEQSKTVTFYRSKLNDLYFDKESIIIVEDFKENITNVTSVPRLIPFNTNVSSECFLVTRIDILTNQRLTEFYDCKCNSSNLKQTNCSYNIFWTDEINEQITEHRSSSTDVVVRQTCNDASEYACFNNGTCIDNDIDQANGHSCKCEGSYTGSRLVKVYSFTKKFYQN